jgi:molecular chaperone GrpE
MNDEDKNIKENEGENSEEIVLEEEIDSENPDFHEKIKKLEEKLKKCRELKEEYLTGWQKARADLINARKDDEKRNQEFAKFANFILISELLPVLDSFDSALERKDDSDFARGIILIKMQLDDVMKKYGLEPMKTIGEKFNLQFHEIVGEAEAKEEEGVIIEEVQKGYLLNGKVLRPAKVKISKSKNS